MYRGFNLKINNINDSFLEVGIELINEQRDSIVKDLKRYISISGKLSGEQMQEDWFPTVNADVFISHSHLNKDNAIKLAWWLNDAFGITAFVDSCIWGHSDDLLRIIDNEYCYKPEQGTYSYERRNISTSHVHMMLSVALSKMIDKTECLFFLNTPESVTASDIIKKTSSSPWIYSEIAMAKMLRKPLKLHRKKLLEKVMSDNISKAIPLEYRIDNEDYTELTTEDLENWKKVFGRRYKEPQTALDVLYSQHSESIDILHS